MRELTLLTLAEREVWHGDSLEQLARLPDNCIDSIVTDPPYGLAFMGKRWDYDVPSTELWAECLRVLKPGGHLLAFAGTRTQHRMAVRIEDAGFEIRDMIAWVYGSGFPKSLDVSKAIDKAAGTEGESHYSGPNHLNAVYGKGMGGGRTAAPYSAATESARQWEGWGTALKPALEPITVARKPLEGTVAANVLAHGTGALNIDGCRVAAPGEVISNHARSGEAEVLFGAHRKQDTHQSAGQELGRWPANLIHDGEGAADLLGEAAKFFQTCKSVYDSTPWPDLNLPPALAGTAEPASCPRRQHAFSVLEAVASEALPVEWSSGVSLWAPPTTSATGSELKMIADALTQTIRSIGSRFWQDREPGELSLSLIPALSVARLEPTGTMTITLSHWKSDGSADPATFSITPMNSEVGAKGSGPFMAGDGARIKYCAKASKRDRDEGLEDVEPQAREAKYGSLQDARPHTADGYEYHREPRRNTHPTVKPTDLMRYLCRLVTPPGGLVLDPFAGSGSTGKACRLEGFRFLGVERDEQYVEIARRRVA